MSGGATKRTPERVPQSSSSSSPRMLDGVPAHRGAGLATALLRTCFQQFAHLGVERVGLEVDDVTLDGALRLYERAGMEVVHHTVVLRMDI